MPFKALLREARDAWATSARARGERVTPSSDDASSLAAALDRLAADERVVLFAVDPTNPEWSLTLGPSRPI